MVFNSNTVPKRSDSSPSPGSLFLKKKYSEFNQMPMELQRIFVGGTGGTGGTSNSNKTNKTSRNSYGTKLV
mgnify:CR=1 FL=1|jgi:hypothetical protein